MKQRPKSQPDVEDRKARPVVASLFSGCGGMDLGFEAGGFDVLAAVEIEQFACATLRANFARTRVLGPPDGDGDIRKLEADQITDHKVDVLIGGPPCQSFSIAAAQRFLKGDKKFKRIGFRDRKRGTLIHEYLRLLTELKPQVFVIENVPGLMHLDGGAQLEDILETCRDAGYKVITQIVQAADYGVPQFRHRLLVVGALREKPDFPQTTHSAGATLLARSHLTVAEALAGLDATAANHVPRNHFDRSIERYRTLRSGQREHLGRVDRLDPFRPSKTVIAGGSNGGGRSHLHPLLARTLTVRECARLQTFPDDFEFFGTTSRQFTQVGNAVPPLLAEHLARQIGRQFFRLQYEGSMKFSVKPAAPSADDCLLMMYEQLKTERSLLYRDTPDPYLTDLLRLEPAV